MDEEARLTTGRRAETGAPPSGDTPIRPAVGGRLLDALDAALVAAWDDDRFVEALAHHEEIVGALVDTEFAIETLRSALLRIEQPDPEEEARGEHE